MMLSSWAARQLVQGPDSSWCVGGGFCWVWGGERYQQRAKWADWEPRRHHHFCLKLSDAGGHIRSPILGASLSP